MFASWNLSTPNWWLAVSCAEDRARNVAIEEGLANEWISPTFIDLSTDWQSADIWIINSKIVN